MQITREQAYDMAFDVIECRKQTIPHTMYCNLCSKVLLRNCTTLFHGTKGKCDCSYHCCQMTSTNVHPAHLTYAPQDAPFIGVIPRNYAYCMDVNGTDDDGIRI